MWPPTGSYWDGGDIPLLTNQFCRSGLTSHQCLSDIFLTSRSLSHRRKKKSSVNTLSSKTNIDYNTEPVHGLEKEKQHLTFLPTRIPGVSASTMKPVKALPAEHLGSGLVRARRKYLETRQDVQMVNY